MMMYSAVCTYDCGRVCIYLLVAECGRTRSLFEMLRVAANVIFEIRV